MAKLLVLTVKVSKLVTFVLIGLQEVFPAGVKAAAGVALAVVKSAAVSTTPVPDGPEKPPNGML